MSQLRSAVQGLPLSSLTHYLTDGCQCKQALTETLFYRTMMLSFFALARLSTVLTRRHRRRSPDR